VNSWVPLEHVIRAAGSRADPAEQAQTLREVQNAGTMRARLA
jgi:hypothetical protein